MLVKQSNILYTFVSTTGQENGQLLALKISLYIFVSLFVFTRILLLEKIESHSNPKTCPKFTVKSGSTLQVKCKQICLQIHNYILSDEQSVFNASILYSIKGTGTRDLIWLKVVSLERS